jgi:hypothetical protein
MALTLVNTYPSSTPGAAYQFAGPQSIPLQNTDGNLLVAFLAWDVTNNVGSTAPVPASSVADSVENWWQLAADSGSTVPGCRTAIWFCANPRALPTTGWWSCALQGYATSLTYTVAEFSGLPSGYVPQIDFTTSVSSASASSLTASATSSQSDYCFVVGAASNGSPAQSNPGSPWTLIAGGAAGQPGVDGVYMGCLYQTASAGSVSAAFSWDSTFQDAVSMIGLSVTSYPPVIVNPEYPVVKTEAAFGANPGDPTMAVLDTAWTDITPWTLFKGDVAGIATSSGKQYELAQPESGTITIALNNQSGTFNPLNAGSPYYSNALNANMSFQSGVPPWTAHASSGAANVSVTQSSVYSYASATGVTAEYSAQVTVAAATTTFPGIASENVTISINDVYSASAWLFLPAGSATAEMAVNWYTSGGTSISQSTGSAVTLADGVWTQVTALDLTPPSTAAYCHLIPQLTGTYSSGITFYVAEAALAYGTAVASTGLVNIGIPVRVSAFWHGRRDPVTFGYVERWPQDWPDFPQWGMSSVVCIDQAGMAAALNMPSALQGEILADNPYVCFPFDEQYSSSANTINGTELTSVDANGLIAINSSRVNQQPAVYHDGDQQILTGQEMSFLGDSGTGMGTSNYGSIATTGNRGPGALYGPDQGMPLLAPSGHDVTVEFWAEIPEVANASTGYQFNLIQLLAEPYIGSAKTLLYTTPGFVIVAGWNLPASGAPNWFVQLAEHNVTVDYPSFTFGDLYGFSVFFSGGTQFMTINGVDDGSAGTISGTYQLTGLQMGHFSYPFNQSSSFTPNWNYSLAYVTVYSSALPAWRQQAHYTAGGLGFNTDTILQRFGRYVAWSYAACLPAGPGGVTDPFQLSAAYEVEGSPLSSALNNDCLSTNSVWYANANGNLVVVCRPATYNIASTVAFGDAPLGPLNANPYFSSGIAFWSAGNNATLSAATSPVIGSMFSLQVTPNGSTADPRAYAQTSAGSSHITVTASTSYSFTALCQCPAGYATGVQLAVDWYTSSATFISTAASGVTPIVGQWQWLALNNAIAPSNAAYGIFYFQATGTPSSSIIFYLANAVVRMSMDQIPFLAATAFDFDNTYVNNITQSTLKQGASTLISPIEKNSASILRFGSRGPLQQDVTGSSYQDAFDRAYWSLGKYDQPSMRVRQLAVDAASNPLAFEAVLSSGIQTVATVSRTPIGGAPWSTYKLTVITEQVEHVIGPGIWQVSYQQSPYVPDDAVLQADTANNVLGSNALPW